jgi:hypothetical protein
VADFGCFWALLESLLQDWKIGVGGTDELHWDCSAFISRMEGGMKVKGWGIIEGELVTKRQKSEYTDNIT